MNDLKPHDVHHLRDALTVNKDSLQFIALDPFYGGLGTSSNLANDPY